MAVIVILLNLAFVIGVPLAITLAVLPLLGLPPLASIAVAIVIFILWTLILALLKRIAAK